MERHLLEEIRYAFHPLPDYHYTVLYYRSLQSFFLFVEAEYACKLKKEIFPLLVEKGYKYKPDGWLGSLLGTKRHYKFFSEDLSQTDVEELLQDLGAEAEGGRTTQEPEGKNLF